MFSDFQRAKLAPWAATRGKVCLRHNRRLNAAARTTSYPYQAIIFLSLRSAPSSVLSLLAIGFKKKETTHGLCFYNQLNILINYIDEKVYCLLQMCHRGTGPICRHWTWTGLWFSPGLSLLEEILRQKFLKAFQTTTLEVPRLRFHLRFRSHYF